MAKKNFTNPTANFISAPETEKTVDIDNYEVPAGYRLVKACRSQRLQLLVPPETAANLRTAATLEGISLNELCNRLFDDFLREGE